MNLQVKRLFLSITTFRTAFPEKLTKYSGIWELDILKKIFGHHTNKPNKRGREKKKKIRSANHVHKSSGVSQTATSGSQDSL